MTFLYNMFISVGKFLALFVTAIMWMDSSAQTTSLNVLNPTVSSWVGSVAGQNGGYSGGGNGPAFNAATNTLIFGYTTATATQRITAEAFAIQHALDLSNSGIQINGYNYSWYINNSGDQSGTLTGQVNFLRGTSVLRTDIYNYNTPTNGFELRTGTQTFTNQESMLAGDSMTLSFTGKDNRFWAGYYGPQVRSPSITLNYTTDPCAGNPTYSPSCPGYAAAYLTQQCNVTALYDPTCPGYTQAYFTQQCTVNALYDSACTGYAAAYLTYQCSINPLYSTTCTGYAEAYKAQQCSLDGLYDRTCPNYSTAYATKMLLEQQGTASIVATAGTVAQNNPAVSTTTASTTVGSDGAVSTGVSTTGDTNIDKAITNKASTTNTTPAAVQLAPPPQQMAQNEPKGGNKQEDKKDDASKGSGGNSPQNTNTASSNKPAVQTTRQALQERREAAAKAEAVEKGKNLANEMGKASDLEAQKAVQNVVIQAMGFTPGFDSYGKAMLPDVVGYKPYSVYNNQRNVENRATLRMFGGTDKLHNDMVESQYQLGK